MLVPKVIAALTANLAQLALAAETAIRDFLDPKATLARLVRLVLSVRQDLPARLLSSRALEASKATRAIKAKEAKEANLVRLVHQVLPAQLAISAFRDIL